MYVITLDIGTTNTRLNLVDNNAKKILYTIKSNTGIRDVAISGDKEILKSTILALTKKAIDSLNLDLSQIQYFVASGMVTSNLGLLEIEHLITPVSFYDLANSVIRTNFIWLNNIPFYFIPGIKNSVLELSLNNLDKIDMMRGEEVETIGIMELCNIHDSSIIILPGSHTKIVYVNEHGQIIKCSTTLFGEILSSLCKNTILSSSINDKLISSINEEFILKGMSFEKEFSFTKAAFAVRLMDVQLSTTSNERANFLGGALASNDIRGAILSEIENGNYKNIYIGGSNPIKALFKIVLENGGLCNININTISDEYSEIAPTIGILKITNEYIKKASKSL